MRFYVYLGNFRIAFGLGRRGIWGSAGRVTSDYRLNNTPWAKHPPRRRISWFLRQVIVVICQMAVLVAVAYQLMQFQP